MSDQMTWAMMRQADAARRSGRIDRRGWSDDQWIADARRLMDELDGAVTSLLNGHVLALLRAVAARPAVDVEGIARVWWECPINVITWGELCAKADADEPPDYQETRDYVRQSAAAVVAYLAGEPR